VEIDRALGPADRKSLRIYYDKSVDIEVEIGRVLGESLGFNMGSSTPSSIGAVVPTRLYALEFQISYLSNRVVVCQPN